MPAVSDQGWRRKACHACARAKRQCNKQTPSCRRCRENHLECRYPRVKKVYASEESPPASSLLKINDAPDVPRPSDAGLDVDFHEFDPDNLVFVNTTTIDDNRPSQGGIDESSTTVVEQEWFFSQESWMLSHLPPGVQQPELQGDAFLKEYISSVQQWLRQWVLEGQNPFIHSRLYQASIPSCIQDAYTSLTAYFLKNSSNENLTFTTIKERAAQLVDYRAAHYPGHVVEQLSQVQALLIYQIICLFDGDISMRAQAEKYLGQLDCWAGQLLQTISGFGEGGGQHIAAADTDFLRPNQDPATMRWKRWIVAESTRRTWVTATRVQAVYLVLQQGWAGCPGTLLFTARKGIWDADSAYSWAKTCNEDGPLLLQQLPTLSDGIISIVRMSEIDEFARVSLALSWGPEKMAKWTDGSAYNPDSLVHIFATSTNV